MNKNVNTEGREQSKLLDENYKAEKTLKVMADVVLIFGSIAAAVMIGFALDKARIEDFTAPLITVITSVVSWAVLNVIRNISINLFEIRKSLKS